jgi:hypothetical protein
MDAKEKNTLWPLAPIAVLFLAIAVISFGFMFKSIDIVTPESATGIQDPLSIEGAISRLETWKEYPEYNIGFGVNGALAIGGAAFSIFCMNKKAKQ